MKKKVLIILALMVFFLPLMQIQQANAATGKVISVGAKKVAKEVAKDAAIDFTFSMIMDYKYVPKDERIKAKAGFEMICLPENRKPAGECSNPLQIKKLTEVDKKSMGSVIEQNLEKKITGGKGMPKWAKFLDWIAPISLIAMGATLLDYAMDSDIASFFDEIGWDSMKDLGFIQTLEGDAVEGDSPYGAGVTISGRKEGIVYLMLRTDPKVGVLRGTKIPFQGGGIFESDYFEVSLTWYGDYEVRGSGNVVGQGKIATMPSDVFNDIYQAKAGELTLTDASLKTAISNAQIPLSKLEYIPVKPTTPQKVPNFDESQIGKDYSKGKLQKVINPYALPMEEIGTGTKVVPYKKPDGTVGYKTVPVDGSEGTEISEDSVIVGDPIIETNPDGSTTVKNPNGGDDGTLPPGKDEEVPPAFPEGETCTATLKLPKFALLFRTMSESFPFSIPWDLKSGFDALFSEMGKEKPSFKYDLKVNNKVHSIDITMPDYFESWMPFAHTMLLFVFDVGILYGIYRLIGGAS